MVDNLLLEGFVTSVTSHPYSGYTRASLSSMTTFKSMMKKETKTRRLTHFCIILVSSRMRGVEKNSLKKQNEQRLPSDVLHNSIIAFVGGIARDSKVSSFTIARVTEPFVSESIRSINMNAHRRETLHKYS